MSDFERRDFVVLGSVGKRLTEHDSEISLNECHLDHSTVVLRGLFETSENAAAFLEPSDQAFDDVAATVGVAVEVDRTSCSVFILFRWDHRSDAVGKQIFVDPVRPVALVSGQLNRIREGIAVIVDDVRSFQQRHQGLRLVRLSGGQMEVQRAPVAVTEKVEIGGVSPSRTA